MSSLSRAGYDVSWHSLSAPCREPYTTAAALQQQEELEAASRDKMAVDRCELAHHNKIIGRDNAAVWPSDRN